MVREYKLKKYGESSISSKSPTLFEVLQKAKKKFRAKIRSNHLIVHVRNKECCHLKDLAGFLHKQKHVGLRKHAEYSAELNRGQTAGRHFVYT
jgi:hypothetical protein